MVMFYFSYTVNLMGFVGDDILYCDYYSVWLIVFLKHLNIVPQIFKQANELMKVITKNQQDYTSLA